MPDIQLNWSFAKFAYSVALVAVIWFFMQELYRVWFEHRLILTVPAYFADGKTDAARGTAFGGLVLAHHHRMTSDLKTEGGVSARGDPVKSETSDVYVLARGLVQEGPSLPPASQQLDLKISGFDVGALLTQLRRWVSPSNEAELTVEARSTGPTTGLVEAVVSWPQAPAPASAPTSLRYFSSGRLPTDDTAASVVAAKLLWADLTRGGDTAKSMPIDEFVPWVLAWNRYRTVRDGGRTPGALLKEETELLEAAGREIQPLLSGKRPVFTEIWRLAANMLALHPACIPNDSHGFDHYRDIYLVSVGKRKVDSPAATDVALSAPRGDAPVIGPGSLVWSADGSAAVKVTAVVKDRQNERYLLTSGLLLTEKTLLPAAVFYGAGPQDRRPAATITRVVELRPGGPTIALAKLEPATQASNGVLGKALAPALKPIGLGGRLTMVGQSKSAKVTAVDVNALKLGSGLIAVSPNVTAAGDAGAPFVDEAGRLQAMGYAASGEASLLIPVTDFLAREKLSLD